MESIGLPHNAARDLFPPIYSCSVFCHILPRHGLHLSCILSAFLLSASAGTLSYRLDVREAELFVQKYRTQMASQLPFVIIPPS